MAIPKKIKPLVTAIKRGDDSSVTMQALRRAIRAHHPHMQGNMFKTIPSHKKKSPDGMVDSIIWNYLREHDPAKKKVYNDKSNAKHNPATHAKVSAVKKAYKLEYEQSVGTMPIENAKQLEDAAIAEASNNLRTMLERATYKYQDGFALIVFLLSAGSYRHGLTLMSHEKVRPFLP
jgi:hypothetical protein